MPTHPEFDFDITDPAVLAHLDRLTQLTKFQATPEHMVHEQTSGPLPPGIYLNLYHGRDDPDQDMEDWGFDGPLIGPFKTVINTYNASVRLLAPDEDHLDIWISEQLPEALLPQLKDSNVLGLFGDMLHFRGKFYGDWSFDYR